MAVCKHPSSAATQASGGRAGPEVSLHPASSASFLWTELGAVGIKLLRIFKPPYRPVNTTSRHCDFQGAGKLVFNSQPSAWGLQVTNEKPRSTAERPLPGSPRGLVTGLLSPSVCSHLLLPLPLLAKSPARMGSCLLQAHPCCLAPPRTTPLGTIPGGEPGTGVWFKLPGAGLGALTGPRPLTLDCTTLVPLQVSSGFLRHPGVLSSPGSGSEPRPTCYLVRVTALVPRFLRTC